MAPIEICLSVSLLYMSIVGIAQAADGVKQGAIVVAPVKTRTFQDILYELVPPMPDQATGVIVDLTGMQMILRRPDKTLAIVEFSSAAKLPTFPAIGTGKTVTAIGKIDDAGILHAQIITRADHGLP